MSLTLVTGASSGLGREVARLWGAEGREVVLLARNAERLAESCRAVAAEGGRAVALCADVRDREALAKALEGVLAGRPLDRVVHAAGVLELGPVGGISEDRLRRLLEVNVLGTLNVVAATLPALEAAGGRLALVSSIVAVLPVPGGFSAYAASKWALRGWGETARDELARRGVSLTLAYPATVDTPMVQGLGPEAPAVYRAWGWHRPERVARRLLGDLERGRRESFSSRLDRASALGMRLAPRTLTRAFHWLTRWRAGG